MERPRMPQGTPAGGRFSLHPRSEAGLTLVEPLNDLDTRRLRRALKSARNVFGEPLNATSRERITLAVTNPGPDTWEAARDIHISTRGAKLWEALVVHTSYDPMRRRSGEFFAVPSREQVLIGLELGAR